uniref:Uncharacterized protein n=1 Tax=Rhizophora mucronata TaxID=61149 RepID=A0A2P2QVB3_RHIMU
MALMGILGFQIRCYCSWLSLNLLQMPQLWLSVAWRT